MLRSPYFWTLCHHCCSDCTEISLSLPITPCWLTEYRSCCMWSGIGTGKGFRCALCCQEGFCHFCCFFGSCRIALLNPCAKLRVQDPQELLHDDGISNLFLAFYFGIHPLVIQVSEVGLPLLCCLLILHLTEPKPHPIWFCIRASECTDDDAESGTVSVATPSTGLWWSRCSCRTIRPQYVKPSGSSSPSSCWLSTALFTSGHDLLLPPTGLERPPSPLVRYALPELVIDRRQIQVVVV